MELYYPVAGTDLWCPMPGFNGDRANLYPGIAKGMPVLRCKGCGKVAYKTQLLAIEKAYAIGITHPSRPYFDKLCGWWHLTSNGGIEWLQQYRAETMAQSIITLRDYQEATLDEIYNYFYKSSGNPVVALPTGTGKSIIIAEFIRRACLQYPGTRIMMLTHVKELIEQNLKTLIDVWPSAPAAVYSAGLNRKEHIGDIIFAGIQSVYSKPELFGHIDLVLVDECHLVAPKAETMYGKFLFELKVRNPNLKIVGFSATPFRMKQGMLTDGGIFHDVCFDLTERNAFNWMIKQGWISPLVPKQTHEVLDVSGVKMVGGEFNQKQLQANVDKDAVTIAALTEMVALAHDRKHWLVFATGIQHAENIAGYLEHKFGINAACIHSKLPSEERDDIIRRFKAGEIRAVVNNNILTTGFDYPDIDCIGMLRPTASPGLWVQMLGRGTRPAPDKENCLVLDFAGNTRRLGPINDPVLPRKRGKGPPGIAPVRLCEHCMCYSHASARFCENPECGVEFPKNVKLTAQASIQEVIAGVLPEFVPQKVDHVVYNIHHKEDRPDSMRVTYQCGLLRFKEYICLDHGGYAARTARQWWEVRSPYGVPPSTHDGMAAVQYLKTPSEITVITKGKYPEIVGYTFNDGSTYGRA